MNNLYNIDKMKDNQLIINEYKKAFNESISITKSEGCQEN